MAKGKTDRPQVLLDLGSYVTELSGVLEPLVDCAKHSQWQLINLKHTRGIIPEPAKLSVAITNELPDSPLACRLRDINCPTIRIGVATHPKDDIMPAILPDLRAMGELAADHFYDRSFKTVGYVRNTPWGKSRTMHESFRNAAETLGMICLALQIKRPSKVTPEKNAFRTYGDEQTLEWLKELPKPVGLLCYSDVLAGRLCFLCQSLGFSVPEDVALIGVGNTVDSRIAPVPLSSIIPNDRATAELAVTMIETVMAGKDAPSRTFVKPIGICERQSSNVLAVSDPIVAKAIRYLWDNLQFPITVGDVVRDLGVSRSTLERRFRTCLQRGLNAELQRKRLERVTDLLITTDLTVAQIATSVCINNLGHLHKTFLRRYGMTPRQYRIRNRSATSSYDV